MNLSERFWRKVQKTDSCWLWIGSRNQKGYGQFSIEGRLHHAHRIAFQLFGGHIPEGFFVLHSCDNPSCVNPRHLRAGTAKENTRDCILKGRDRKRRKLTDDQVVAVCNELRRGRDAHLIAEQFGIHWTHVYRLSRKRASSEVSA